MRGAPGISPAATPQTGDTERVGACPQVTAYGAPQPRPGEDPGGPPPARPWGGRGAPPTGSTWPPPARCPGDAGCLPAGLSPATAGRMEQRPGERARRPGTGRPRGGGGGDRKGSRGEEDSGAKPASPAQLTVVGWDSSRAPRKPKGLGTGPCAPGWAVRTGTQTDPRGLKDVLPSERRELDQSLPQTQGTSHFLDVLSCLSSKCLLLLFQLSSFPFRDVPTWK